ncbi:MAG: flagellar filament capping protein FliD, partial [Rickettsiaceae bacterium]|nr:flagellar filament capping protein FliD [Rickettsiaceae bacterium]
MSKISNLISPQDDRYYYFKEKLAKIIENNKISESLSAASSNPTTSSEFGRGMVIDGFKNKENLKFHDVIKYNPKVESQEKLVKSLEEKYQNMVLLEATLQFLQSEEIKSAIDSSLKIREYSTLLGIKAAELKSASISTNDTDDAETYMKVEASSSTSNQEITVSIWNTATSYNISIGTEDSTEPTAVYNAIQAANSVTAARDAALAAVSSLSGDGFPSNPQSRTLYSLCYVEALKTSSSLASLKTQITNIWNGMNKTISDGFETTDTVIVGTGADLLPAGTYYLYCMPNSIYAAKALSTYITQANSVSTAIAAIASTPNITREDVVTAISGITGLTYNGSGLPSNNDFAYAIAYPAYTAALPNANGGTLAATVKTAASNVATSANAKTYADDFGINTYQAGSPILTNIAFTSLLQSLTDAANTTGATLSSVQTSVAAALSAYKTKCSITLTNDGTLQTVVDSINFTTQYSGVGASAILSGSGNYILNIYGTNTGIDYAINIFNSSESDVKSTIFGQVIKFESPGTSAIVQAGNSSFKQMIVSNSNTISYGQAYFTLLKANTSSSEYQTITIGDDATIYKNKIVDFVDSLNNLIIFIARQNQVDPNDPNKYKVTTLLRYDPILRSLSLLVNNALNYTVSYDSGYTSLASLGIDTEQVTESGDLQYNLLRINSDIPSTSKTDNIKDSVDLALNSDYIGTRRVFECMNTISSSKLILNGFNGIYND